MKHRLFTFLLAVAASLGTMFASDIQVNGIWYNFDSSTQTATVTYRGTYYSSYSNEYSGNISIPSTVTYEGQTYNVTSIGPSTFEECSSLVSVVIPNSVTSIGYSAFGACSGLTSVTIPNSVTSIGDYAFYLCSDLTSIEIPNSVTRIGTSAFNRCTGLTSMDIPNSVTSIGAYVFYLCSGLTSMSIGNSVTTISSHAFDECLALASVMIPTSVANIEEGAFRNCSALTTIDIPNSVTSIGESAFRSCTGLTSIAIPNSVTTIGNEAFAGCWVLSSIEIPNSLTSIGESAFSGCRVITSITNYATMPQVINASTFNDLNKYACTLYVPAESVEAYQTADVWKEFPHIQAIEGNTPEPCIIASGTCGAEGDNLAWTLSCDSVLTISGTGAMADYEWNGAPWYSNNEAIRSVIIENSVTSIGDYAFYPCSGLTSVTIPNSVTSIGDYAFENCTGLTSPVYNAHVFAFMPTSYSGAYTIPDGIESIAGVAFGACSGLTSVTIPNSVTSIGDWAFAHCTGLTSVTIPNSVTSIGSSAFMGCTGLTSVTIPNSVTSIGDGAFNGCSNLNTITNYATIPQPLDPAGFSVFGGVPFTCTLYVPAESLAAYQAADVWKDFGNILPIEGTEESNYASLADIYNMAADSVFTLGAFDVVYVASYQNGANMYIKDASGSGVIYMPSYGLQAGDHVEAGLQGKVHIYNGLYEITPISTKEELTITSGEAPAPMKATEAPSLANVNQYVVYKGVSFSTDTSFVEGNRHMVYGTWNGQEIAFYNQYHIGTTLSTDKTYNITAVNSVYGTVLEVYPLAVEEVDSVPDLCVIASGTCGAEGDNLIWTLTCDSVLTISGTGEMADYEWNTGAAWYSNKESIKSVIIENGVTSIGWFAFADCSGLTSVTIPNSVTSIGYEAFYYCTGLTSVTIPNSVTSIGEDAFSGCASLPVIDNIRYADTYLIEAVDKTLSTYSIKEGTRWIGRSAFYDCSGLTSVTIPNSVTSIGSQAFQGSGLSYVRIPSNVTSLGLSIFAGCSDLSSIDVDVNNPYYCSIDGVLFKKYNTILKQYPGGKQGAYAIPNGVTSIDIAAFYGCSGLTSVEIPNSVTSIGEWAFYSCSSLTSIDIPNSVTSIGRDAFWNCTGLTSVSISNSVTSIGEETFADCISLTSFTNYALQPQMVNSNVFVDVDKSACTLYVPAESIEAYKTADVWKEFGTILPLGGQPIEPIEGEYNVLYVGQEGDSISSEEVTLHLPVAPVIEGFLFVGWQTVSAMLTEGIIIQAVYQAEEPTSAPAVYTNPANPTQKLLRNGNVYILTDDKIYSITGQTVR